MRRRGEWGHTAEHASHRTGSSTMLLVLSFVATSGLLAPVPVVLQHTVTQRSRSAITACEKPRPGYEPRDPEVERLTGGGWSALLPRRPPLPWNFGGLGYQQWMPSAYI